MTEASDEYSLAWWDHYQMNFWLWASIADGREFLSAHKAFLDHLTPTEIANVDWPQRQSLQYRQDLAKYHFVIALGSLLRTLRRAETRYPAIAAAVASAPHLTAEGKNLRDMIEHSDEYVRGKGRRDDFVRRGPDTSLPGDEPGTADATSLVVDDRGHWIGGRLNVERALREVEAIKVIASTIPPPVDARIQ